MDQSFTLHNGLKMPALGLGTWNAPKDTVGEAIKYAILEAGYRHLDCASVYGNEKEIGAALKEIFTSGKVKREDVFITSKLWNNDHNPADVEAACRKTLADLNLDYLDLYLMHWYVAFPHVENSDPVDKNGDALTAPIPVQETWQAMEQLVKKGLVKSIGVANFTAPMLIDLWSYAKIQPVVDQIELHPYNSQQRLVEYCQKKSLVVTAYSPLGTPGGLRPNDPVLMADPTIQTIAKAHQKTPAQVALNWAMTRKTVPIPKSTHLERIKENMGASDFALTTDDMEKLNALNKDHRFVDPFDWWKIPYFS